MVAVSIRGWALEIVYVEKIGNQVRRPRIPPAHLYRKVVSVPVRIYALAKDLGIDNAQLLDICQSVGISGKGSALASLDDDEAVRIKDFMSGGGQVATAEEEPDNAPIRPDHNEDLKSPVRELAAHSSESDAPPVVDEAGPLSTFSNPPQVEEPESPPVEEPMAKEPVAKSPEVPAAPKPSKKPERSSPLRPLMERPRNETRELRDMDRKPKPGEKGGGGKPSRQKPRPNIVRVAAMPEVKQPVGKSNNPTEKVQKPDISLGKKDAAAARSKEGRQAPLDQFNKQSKSKPKETKAPRRGRSGGVATPAPTQVLGEMPGRGGARSRKDKERKEGDSGIGSTRQTRTKRRRTGRDDDRYSNYRHRNRQRRGPAANTAAPRKDSIVLQMPCSVRSFSEAAGIPAVKVLLTIKSIDEAFTGTINTVLSDDSVEMLVEHFELENLDVRAPESLEDAMLEEFEALSKRNAENGVLRPPIVTFLGHVDHGKTSLLDAIIGIDVVSGEAGGITQHIRAYEVNKEGKKIAFVDTPGHEAFTEMRARGANVTDVAVLVVAADDGVMPQTEEAISHAKAAGVPIIVALNKIDLPGVTADKALQDLASHELLPSEWGGEVEVVRTSATAGTGIDDLLETILVTAELHEYKADPSQAAFGTCLEAEQESDRGVMAKIMVQTGTLNVGDVVVCGAAHGRVKAMYDTLRPKKKVKKAGPSTPVNLAGLDVAPEAGDKFYVLDDIAKAREIAEARAIRMRYGRVGSITTKVDLESFLQQIEEGTLGRSEDVIKLNLIIRADVRGSIEAIKKELSKIKHPEISIDIRQALVGGVTIADVRLAQATQAVIIAFNVVPDEAAKSLADELLVQVRRYDIIYKVTDDIKATLEGKLKPEEQVVEQGMAMVLRTFSISKTGTIAGCRVMRGSILRDCKIRVIRESRIIGEYQIDTLKRVKDDVKEVQRGMECGIKLAGFNDIKEGDTLEAYRIEEVARKLEV